MMNIQTKKRIVVIGGGFAGLSFIKNIDTRQWEVHLVDRNNYHSFPPLFYQLASGGLDAGSICFALRRELRSHKAKGVIYHMGTVHTIDTDRKIVVTRAEQIPYDTLVIAAGTTNNFFGNEDLKLSVHTLKSIPEAIRCRNDIIARLERAAITYDAAKRRQMLTFAIIGGGPTGVEIAGALGEMKRFVLPREYPSINNDEFSVTLIEGSDRLLGAMSPLSSAKVLDDLKNLMVNVRLQTSVKAFDGSTLTFADGSEMKSNMVIWTAGITGEQFDFVGKKPTMARGNRFVVDDFSRVVGLEDVYAIGDIAGSETPEYPHGYPQVAQVAIQAARNLARNLSSRSPSRPFVYNDKGTMATVGRNRAVVELPHLRLSGRIAWLVWMGVHLMSLLGMRNKITVFVTWVWAYFTYSSSVRLLLRLTRYPLRPDNHSHYHPAQ